ncbi:MAG: hypothetical protein IPJ65_01150 [Archangiaceae bacterium]|nr:hypothetical protein [Archangiaceae bacterium]
MAISPAAKTLNTSAHTLADLQQLAKAEPQTAVAYLTGVESRLRAAGKSAEADTVKALLGKTGTLVEQMAAASAQLAAIFPADAAGWGDVQLKRADTIGFSASAPAQGLSPASPMPGATMPGAEPVQPSLGVTMPGAEPVQPSLGVTMPGAAPVQPSLGVTMPGAAPMQPSLGVTRPVVSPLSPSVGVSRPAAPPPPGPVQYVTGTVNVSSAGLTFTTDGGRELKLAQSALATKLFQMGNDMMEGFVGDGPITLQGTLGEDNATFNVEAYALNSDGNFGAFTFGRVTVAADTGAVTIDGTRGPVEVQDPELKRVLASMPQFAVIVPGAAEEKDGKLVHTAAPRVLMGLARFKVPPPATATGETTSMSANMANNHFVMKPLIFPSAQLARANHQSRLWARGWPDFGPDGEPSQFKADYISQQLDRRTLPVNRTSAQDADPVQAAVMQDIV